MSIGILEDVKKYVEQWQNSLKIVRDIQQEVLTNDNLAEAIKRDAETVLIARGVPADTASVVIRYLSVGGDDHSTSSFCSCHHLPDPQVQRRFESQKGKESSDIIIESICGGSNESQDVELYDGNLGVTVQFVNAYQSPIGQVQWNSNLHSKYQIAGNVAGVRWGSGTLISRNLFITAGHLFDSESHGFSLPRLNGTNTTISPVEIARNMHVNFNYQYDPSMNLRPEQSFNIVRLLEYRTGGIDYAIVELERDPGGIFGYTLISESDPELDALICIMGYQNGMPKRLDAGHISHLDEYTIGYNSIDTLGGDSGSPILLSPYGILVGVHTNGGCDDPHVGQNHGQKITPIIHASHILSSWTTQ